LETGLRSVLEKLADVEASARSDDGLIEAFVGGRAELTRLVLDPRVFRGCHSVALAGDIADTVRRAGERAAAQVAELTRTALAEAAGRWS
jgi:DNA-binding protein YbaB